MIDPDSVQHVNVKIFVADATVIDLADAIPVFHRWIRDSVREEMLIDVADYRHVPEGPGVMLIGHQADYSLDLREDSLGLLYNRKTALGGTFQDRLRQAYDAAWNACRMLEKEPPFQGKLKFQSDICEVFINDRLLAPNTDETWSALRPELERFFPDRALERRGEKRDLFRVRAHTPGSKPHP